MFRRIADSGLVGKSGIMLGLGETRKEVLETLQDLRNNGCKVVTIGQYLQPATHLQAGQKMGYSYVESHPLVRSSYHAERHINA